MNRIHIDQLKEIGFFHLSDLQLVDNKLTLCSSNDCLNSVYALVIDNYVIYIGKTVKFRKRFDTYRNCINWVSCKDNNRKKTSLLVEALEQNKKVQVFYKPALFNCTFHDFNHEELTVSSLPEEEKRIINKFKPKWNIHHV